MMDGNTNDLSSDEPSVTRASPQGQDDPYPSIMGTGQCTGGVRKSVGSHPGELGEGCEKFVPMMVTQ